MTRQMFSIDVTRLIIAWLTNQNVHYWYHIKECRHTTPKVVFVT